MSTNCLIDLILGHLFLADNRFSFRGQQMTNGTNVTVNSFTVKKKGKALQLCVPTPNFRRGPAECAANVETKTAEYSKCFK